MVFIEPVIRSTCFEHYYAHHQELETIQMVPAYGTSPRLGLVAGLMHGHRLCVRVEGCCCAHHQELETIQMIPAYGTSPRRWLIAGLVHGRRLCARVEGCCSATSRDGHNSAQNMLSEP
jgi:hypothetical protein